MYVKFFQKDEIANVGPISTAEKGSARNNVCHHFDAWIAYVWDSVSRFWRPRIPGRQSVLIEHF
jgi:hypothetical protein